MKIALVHDQLYEFGGAERVFLLLTDIFPKADIYTAFVDKKKLDIHAPKLTNRKINSSFVGKIPFIEKIYSPLRFLAPRIWESFDFSGYDLVISSSGWYMCKGVSTSSKKIIGTRLGVNKKPIHISYIHHPPRYLYGYETALNWKKHWLIRVYGTIINHFLRIWDFESSQRPDYLIANSKETQRRIQKFYRRDSRVIYPCVFISKRLQVTGFRLQEKKYYVTVSRLQKAKHIDLLIEAANKMKFALKIVGEGKDRQYLQSIAGPTVEFLGNIEDRDFEKLYKRAKAFLFASVDEEFGIAPVEAMGYAVPVIAYKSGGLIETVKPGVNGFLYDKLDQSSIVEAVKKFESLSEKRYLQMCNAARKEAEKFSEENFKKNILKFIESVKKK